MNSKNNANKKIKVLIVGITGNLGGVENYICNLAENIDHKEFELSFLVHEKPANRVLERIDSIGKIHYVTGAKKNFFKFLKDIFDFYRKNKFDVVHINECSSAFSIYLLPLLIRKRKTKIIIHSHNSNTDKKSLIKSLCARLQKIKADALWSCSESAGNYLFGKKSNYLIIKNGINLETFSFLESNRTEIRTEFGINKDVFVIGNVGRFELQKNHERLITIFKEYLKKDNEAVLFLVGEGSLNGKIKEQVKALRIDDKVIFAGVRKDVEKLLSAFDLFFLPSLFEGLPYVGIEAQCSGLPLVYSNAISDELKITSLASSFSLDLSDEAIAMILYDAKNRLIDRHSALIKEGIRKAGYDVKDITEKTGVFYKELINNK